MPGSTAAPTRGAIREAIAAKLRLSGPQHTTDGPQVASTRPAARLPRLHFDPQRLAERCLQDAMAEALPAYYLSRAFDFDMVHPDELPLPLTATPEQTAAASPAAQTALACRRHAWLLRKDGVPAYIGDEIRDVLQELTR
jgi:hypothetical protein